VSKKAPGDQGLSRCPFFRLGTGTVTVSQALPKAGKCFSLWA